MPVAMLALLLIGWFVPGGALFYTSRPGGFDSVSVSTRPVFAYGNFLTILGMTLLFATDSHHLVISALNESYRIFSPGELPPSGDVAATRPPLRTSACEQRRSTSGRRLASF